MRKRIYCDCHPSEMGEFEVLYKLNNLCSEFNKIRDLISVEIAAGEGSELRRSADFFINELEYYYKNLSGFLQGMKYGIELRGKKHE